MYNRKDASVVMLTGAEVGNPLSSVIPADFALQLGAGNDRLVIATFATSGNGGGGHFYENISLGGNVPTRVIVENGAGIDNGLQESLTVAIWEDADLPATAGTYQLLADINVNMTNQAAHGWLRIEEHEGVGQTVSILNEDQGSSLGTFDVTFTNPSAARLIMISVVTGNVDLDATGTSDYDSRGQLYSGRFKYFHEDAEDSISLGRSVDGNYYVRYIALALSDASVVSLILESYEPVIQVNESFSFTVSGPDAQDVVDNGNVTIDGTDVTDTVGVTLSAPNATTVTISAVPDFLALYGEDVTIVISDGITSDTTVIKYEAPTTVRFYGVIEGYTPSDKPSVFDGLTDPVVANGDRYAVLDPSFIIADIFPNDGRPDHNSTGFYVIHHIDPDTAQVVNYINEVIDYVSPLILGEPDTQVSSLRAHGEAPLFDSRYPGGNRP